MVVAASDASGDLDYWWQGSDGWWRVQNVAASQDSAPRGFLEPSIAWTSHSVVIAALSRPIGGPPGGALYYWWQAADTEPWNQEGPLTPEPGNVYVGPSIAWTDKSVVIAAANPSDGHVYYWWQAHGSPTWSLPQQVD